MNFQRIMLFCLNFIKKTLQLELDNFVELDEGQLPISKQAFSKARQRISPEAFKELYLMTAETFLNEADAARFKGYRIFAIDGTELELSRSEELSVAYPPSRPLTTAPRARVSIMCDVLSDAVVHTDISNLSVDERTLAINHLNYFKATATQQNKSLFIFDRGYPSKNLIEYFEDNNLKYLMRFVFSIIKVAHRAPKSLAEGDKK